MTRYVVDAGAVIELARLSATIPAQHRLLAPTLLRSQTLSIVATASLETLPR
jgi:hypothetical protein